MLTWYFLIPILMVANEQVATFIKLVSRKLPFAATIFQKKNKPEKCPFIVTNNYIVLAV